MRSLLFLAFLGCATEPSTEEVSTALVGSVSFSPPQPDAGSVRIGTIGSTTVIVTSSMPVMAVTDVRVTGAGFTLGATTCGAAVVRSCQVRVDYTPATYGPATGQLSIVANGDTFTAPLHAVGLWHLAATLDGTGTITSIPAGIECGATCDGWFPDGAELEVLPASGYTVGAWSVAGCVGLRCRVAPSAAGRTVSATLVRAPGRPIYVTKDGDGAGTVTSNRPAIDCGDLCANVVAGDVTLVATAAAGDYFAGWSDPSCGSSTTCVVPAGTEPVRIRATFVDTAIVVTIAGGAPGEVSAFRLIDPESWWLDYELVGTCSHSCVIPKLPGELVIVAATPNTLESLVAPGCVRQYDRCTVSSPGTFEVTATFGKHAKDRWTFFGAPGETFQHGAFDTAGNLIATSQQRLVSLDPTGALRWTHAPAQAVLTGPAGAIYIVDPTRGTVKLDAAGNDLWIRDGFARAIDPSGNVLVHRPGNTMTLLAPDGTELWTAPGAGVGIDENGTIYEPGIREELDEGGDNYFTMYAKRYSPAGTPMTDFVGTWNTPYGDTDRSYLNSYDLVVAPHLLSGMLGHGDGDYTSQDLSVLDESGARVAGAWIQRGWPSYQVTAFQAVAGQDIGMLHASSSSLTYYGADYGFRLRHLVPGGGSWNLERWDTSYFGYDDFDYEHDVYGFVMGGLAGGPTGDLAMLGSYQPARMPGAGGGWVPDRPAVGVIQSFAP